MNMPQEKLDLNKHNTTQGQILALSWIDFYGIKVYLSKIWRIIHWALGYVFGADYITEAGSL